MICISAEALAYAGRTNFSSAGAPNQANGAAAVGIERLNRLTSAFGQARRSSPRTAVSVAGWGNFGPMGFAQ
jgi:hypothetical protein